MWPVSHPVVSHILFSCMVHSGCVSAVACMLALMSHMFSHSIIRRGAYCTGCVSVTFHHQEKCILGVPQLHSIMRRGAYWVCLRYILSSGEVHTGCASVTFHHQEKCILGVPQLHSIIRRGAYWVCLSYIPSSGEVHSGCASVTFHHQERCILGVPQLHSIIRRGAYWVCLRYIPSSGEVHTGCASVIFHHQERCILGVPQLYSIIRRSAYWVCLSCWHSPWPSCLGFLWHMWWKSSIHRRGLNASIHRLGLSVLSRLRKLVIVFYEEGLKSLTLQQQLQILTHLIAKGDQHCITLESRAEGNSPTVHTPN